VLAPPPAGSPGAEGDEPGPAGRTRAGGILAVSPRTLLALAAWVLGSGLSLGDGHLDPGGVIALILTWALVVAAFVSRATEDTRRTERALGIGVVVQLAMMTVKPPGEYLRADLLEHPFLAPLFPLAMVLVAVLAATVVVDRPLLGRATFPAIVALSGIAAVWMLFASPHPSIDVLDFTRESARVLAQGRNPYEDLHLHNIYGHTRYFGPGFATDQTIDVGLVYPPMSLLLTSLGQWLAGDSRATLVLALVVTAVLIDRLGGRAARLCAILFLTTPRQYFVLEHGWTEPLFVCGFALLLLLARRRARGTAVVLGALLALKQFAVLLLPLLHLLVGELRPRRSLRLLALALVVAAALIAPFFFWDPHAYLRSTVLFHLAQPFRADSLSFAALWAWARGGVAPPTTVPTLICLGVALVVALRRCRATPAGFAAGCALVLLATLAWSKQAHCNYLYLVVGLLLCSVAAAEPESAPSPRGRTVG
jgi:hypothetical protein